MSPDQIADNCPECLAGPNVPHTTRAGGDSVTGVYRCRECGHGWTCSWDLESLAVDEAKGDAA